jgi:hypothetical protein
MSWRCGGHEGYYLIDGGHDGDHEGVDGGQDGDVVVMKVLMMVMWWS